MAVQLTRHRFTVDEYYQMAAAGVFGEDDRVELIEGEIVDMSPIGRRHVTIVNRLNDLFAGRVRDRVIVSVQNPVRLGERNEPQPDLVLFRRSADYYARVDPTPADVFLVIEIADSSLVYDQQVKAPLYARHGIAEYWLVDLTRDHVVVYREPTSAGYGTTRVARRGESLSALAFPDVTLTVDDILG